MNDLSKTTRDKVAKVLAQSLADSIDLEYQFKQAHWNVRGGSFIALHELFDKLAGEISGNVDELAERLVQLGHQARGTVQEAAAKSALPAFPLGINAQEEILAALVKSVGAYAASVRKAIDTTDAAGDKDTADLFTGISRGADKMLWFLSAHQTK